MSRGRSASVFGTRLAVILAVATLAVPAAAQRQSQLPLVGPAGAAGVAIPIGYHRGYAAVPLAAMTRIGWTVGTTERSGIARRGDELVELVERSPFFRWSGAVLQLTAEPYRMGDDLWVPLQLLSDFLPDRRAEEYAFRTGGSALEVKIADAWTPQGADGAREDRPAATPTASPGPSVPAPPRTRVVVIDAGHGGPDSGARGPRGVREKDVALRIALALARELEGRPGIEVHLTRAHDRLVPLWERGEWATGVKGERLGVFVSLHANSGQQLSARGFETYFLSEARTEHERRVAAIENAPFRESERASTSDDAELQGIVQELRTLDHQHWSALLAELTQEELDRVHPGPNRGVKQGPLAVITNSLMPAVLVEVGFISNRDEERLLDSADFQADAGRALARAIERFFERYPPEGTGLEGGRRQ
jgi:N-acetylmuramoyl-L-alanine amidase